MVIDEATPSRARALGQSLPITPAQLPDMPSSSERLRHYRPPSRSGKLSGAKRTRRGRSAVFPTRSMSTTVAISPAATWNRLGSVCRDSSPSAVTPAARTRRAPSRVAERRLGIVRCGRPSMRRSMDWGRTRAMVATSVNDETGRLRLDACAVPCAENATAWTAGVRRLLLGRCLLGLRLGLNGLEARQSLGGLAFADSPDCRPGVDAALARTGLALLPVVD